MPQKNSSILFTLITSVFMMVFVSVFFHLPKTSMNGAITSSFLASQKREQLQEISHTSTLNSESIDPETIRSLTQ